LKIPIIRNYHFSSIIWIDGIYDSEIKPGFLKIGSYKIKIKIKISGKNRGMKHN